MDQDLIESQGCLESYIASLSEVIGHADRVEPLENDCHGLLLPLERRSVQPLAAAVAPGRVSARRQSLPHFVAHSPWSADRILAKVRELVLPSLERGGPIEAWIVDDTGLPRKGKHSVGVARQCRGQSGKQDNCQVAVSLSIANAAASLPMACRLYLPKTRARDAGRRRKAGVPEEAVFKTKPEIALKQITAAPEAGVASGVVPADAGYGNDTGCRGAVSALGLKYAMGALSSTRLWPPGQEPLAPKSKGRRGRPGTRLRRDEAHRPVSARDLAMSLKPQAWKTLTWRGGANAPLSGRFAAVRGRPAHRDQTLSEPRPREWLLIEWPSGEEEPTKYWLSTLPANTRRTALVGMARMRWRVERDYQELRQEAGLGHYAGRGWRGFHHHATLCIAACGFLISQRETIPPSRPRWPARRKAFSLPEGDRPRGGADPARASRHQLNRNDEANQRHSIGPNTPAMPMLRKGMEKAWQTLKFMTQ